MKLKSILILLGVMLCSFSLSFGQNSSAGAATPNASYDAGYAAGKAIGSANSTYNDTAPSSVSDVTQYRTGYLDGYRYGYNLVYLLKTQSKASDPYSYQLGYAAPWQNIQYNSAIAKDAASYNMGYFDGMADRSQFLTGGGKKGPNGKGTNIIWLDSGTMVVKDTNGMTYVRNGGVYINISPNGTSTTSTLISADAKGNSVWKESNGATLNKYADGSWYYQGLNGYWAYFQYGKDRSCQQTSNKTFEVWDNKNGYYSYTDATGKTTWYKNGVVCDPPTS